MPQLDERTGAMTDFELHTALESPPSPARTRPPQREPMRVGLVQDRWQPDSEEHEASLTHGVELAAAEGARLICLQELTLSPYFAIEPDAFETARERAELIPDGPTCRFAARLAATTGAWVH